MERAVPIHNPGTRWAALWVWALGTEQLCGCEPWELSSSVGVSLGNWAALWVWTLGTEQLCGCETWELSSSVGVSLGTVQLCGCEPWELSSSVGVSLGNWAALWVWALGTLTSPQKVRVVLVDWSLTVISDLGQLYVRYILPISQYLLINKVGSLETAFNNVWDHSNIRSFASPFLPPDFCSVSDMIAYMFPQWILWKTTWVKKYDLTSG
jgi:hypothetical protein